MESISAALQAPSLRTRSHSPATIVKKPLWPGRLRIVGHQPEPKLIASTSIRTEVARSATQAQAPRTWSGTDSGFAIDVPGALHPGRRVGKLAGWEKPRYGSAGRPSRRPA